MENTPNDPVDLKTEKPNEPNPVDIDSSKPDDMVKYSTYRKTVGEIKALRDKHSDAIAELANYRAKEKADREKQLIADKEFDKVIADKNAAIEKLQGDLNVAETNSLDYRKMHSFIAGLGAAKLDPKYFSLVPLESISLDDSGEIQQESLVKAIDEFKTEHPRLLVTSKPDFPKKKVGDSKTGGLTLKEWKSLKSSKEQRERWKDVIHERE